MENQIKRHCRFCAELKNAIELVKFSNTSSEDEVISKLSCLNANCINLTPNIDLPKTICVDCLTMLRKTFNFVSKIEKSQHILRAFYRNNGVKDENENSSRPCLDKVTPKIKLEINYLDFLENTYKETCDTGCPDIEIDTFVDECDGSNDNSWSGLQLKCSFCDEICVDINRLRSHCKLVHKQCYGTKCLVCNEKFGDFNTFVDHAIQHKKSLRLYCHFCNKKFECEITLESHLAKHDKICKYCGQLFATITSRNNHLKKYHPAHGDHKELSIDKKKEVSLVNTADDLEDESWNSYKWKCQLCNHEFTNLESLRSHVKDTHKKCFAFKCMDCMEIMKNYKGFLQHVYKHKPHLRRYCQYCNQKIIDPKHIENHFEAESKVCKDCGEVLKNKSELKQHNADYKSPSSKKNTLTKQDKPKEAEDLTYECDICGKVAKSLSNLYTHKQVHTDRKRSHICDRCGKAFYSKSVLRNHEIIHNNPEPQVCKICKKTFLTIIRLKKHVSTHYGEKPFKCDQCNRGFRLKEQLRTHMITHTDIMPFQCQFCDKKFRHKHRLNAHLLQHTGVKPYSCRECGMDFVSWSNCNKHMKRKHGQTLAKHVLTPQGKLPINPKTGKPKLVNVETEREWAEEFLLTKSRGKSKIPA